MKFKYVLLMVVLIGGLGGGVYYYNNINAEEIPVMTIKETTVKKGDLLIDFLADGIVTMDVSDVKLQSSGLIEAIHVGIGDVIAVGDLVATLDTNELNIKLAQNQLAIKSIEAKIQEESNSTIIERTYQKEIINYVEKDIIKEKELLDSMKTYTLVYTTSDIEKQQEVIDELEEKLSLETLKLNGMVAPSTTQDLLDIEDIQLDIQLIEQEIEQAKIVANSQGTVIEIKTMSNEVVNSGNILLTVQDQLNPYIIASISEMDIHQVEVGQKVLAEFESSFGLPYTGSVSFVNSIPQIDNNGIVTYEVHLTLDEYPENLMSGLTSFLSFVLKERKDVLIVPNSTIILQDGVQYVELKKDNGSSLQKVSTGLTDGINVEVIDGIEVGDILITRSEGK